MTNTEAPVLKLKRGEDRRIRAGHPWVFSNEVDTAATPLSKRVARRRRAHSFGPRPVPGPRIRQSPCAHLRAHRRARCRATAGSLAHRASAECGAGVAGAVVAEPYYRLVFGESDGLPGLVLDRYGDIIVGQIATRGMEALKQDVEEVVRSVIAPRGLYWKNDSGARELEQLESVAEVAFGEVPDEIEVIEAGFRFMAPLAPGRRRAGSTIRPPIVRALPVISGPVRACSTCAVTWAHGLSRL